ncbi:MAG: hypothetical protein M0Q87_15230, partial [Ottowia sp.]|nr:hypothetical protein [Ottowia sp.]
MPEPRHYTANPLEGRQPNRTIRQRKQVNKLGKKSHIKKNRQTKKDAINAQIEALNELTVPEKESLAQTT